MTKTERLLESYDKCAVEKEEVRQDMVKEAAKLDPQTAVPFLKGALTDKSYVVREEALKAICAFAPEVAFPVLDSMLRDHENATVRNAAIEAFPRYGAQAGIHLGGLLKDEDEEIRQFAALILGEINDPFAVEKLVEALDDPDENVRHAAAESLGKIGDARAVPHLINSLNDSFWIQYPAVVSLGQIGDPSAVSHLIQLTNDELLSQPAIRALGAIADISVIPVLASILRSCDSELRNETLAALVKIQSKIDRFFVCNWSCIPSIKKALDRYELIEYMQKSLADDEMESRKNAIIALGWLKKKQAVPKLIELLEEYELEEYVMGALASIGPEATPDLVSALATPDPKLRAALIRTLDWIGDEKSVMACLPHIQDEDEEVRHQAIMALDNLVESEAVEDALLKMLSGPSPETTALLVEIMGKSGSPALPEKLISLLDADCEKAGHAAVKILGKLKSRQAAGPLTALLDDENGETRAEALRALCNITDGNVSLSLLWESLSDESVLVRKAVAECMGRGHMRDSSSILFRLLQDGEPEVRFTAIESLVKVGGPEEIKDITERFMELKPPLKLTLVRSMSNIRDKYVTDFLMGLVKSGEADLKRAAIDSLAEIKERRAVPDILVALDDPDWVVRSRAVRALGLMGDHQGLNHIVKKLDEEEALIQKEAIIALGRLGNPQAVPHILSKLNREELQSEALLALEKLGFADLDYFFQVFYTFNTRIKCALVDLVGRTGDERAVEHLTSILLEEFYTVRCRAARALGEIKDRQAIPALLQAHREDPSEEVRKAAAMALKKLDSRS